MTMKTKQEQIIIDGLLTTLGYREQKKTRTDRYFITEA